MKEKHIIKECKHHGKTEYILEPSRDAYRCKRCRVENVTRKRKKIKKQLVEYFGGQCESCGYNKCIAALDFHHKNPNDKNFGISHRGLTRSFKKVLMEAKKCILLCSNCHRELEHSNSVKS